MRILAQLFFFVLVVAALVCVAAHAIDTFNLESSLRNPTYDTDTTPVCEGR